jgi:hypothetical protein
MLQRIFKGYGVELHPITPLDLPSLRRWRNSSRIRFQMADTSYVLPNQQRRWFEEIQKRDDEAHWMVWYNDVRVGWMKLKGNGPLLSQQSLDGGLYVGNSRVKHGLLGYAIALMQLEIVFEHLKVPVYKTSFRDTNVQARKFNKQLGYREVDHKDGFIWVVITLESHAPAKQRLMRYFESKNQLFKAKR